MIHRFGRLAGYLFEAPLMLGVIVPLRDGSCGVLPSLRSRRGFRRASWHSGSC